MKKTFKFLLFVTFAFVLANCARTGRPEGGPKDEDAPLLVIAKPPYENTNFKEKNIKLSFNEYIKLKDLNKQLVISPPMKYAPLITPQGFASEYLNIEIVDTLQKNTTYIINFGNSIEDNNENNPLERFKYVFSTGKYIDSLKYTGRIKDALLEKPNKDFNVLLYRIDSTYTDSIVYKEKPSYVTTTTDSINFKFTNLKEGKYFLVALKENQNDYIFDPKLDNIGFYKDTIQLPKDTILNTSLSVFKETQPFKFGRAKESKKGQIIFPFYGEQKDLKATIISDVPKDFKSISKFEKEKDTLNYWFTPFEVDSLNFIVTNKDLIDTITVRLRKKKLDSLTINPSTRGSLNFRDTFYLKTNNPLIKIDTSKISLMNKDSVFVKFESIINQKENKVAFVFEKKPVQSYDLSILPKAFEDIYNFKNDTLKYKMRTKEIEDFGRITLKIENIASKNYIIELLDAKLNIVQRNYINNTTTVVYDLLEAKTYTLRAIEDLNKNNIWDTGNFLQRRLPEKIIYFSDEPLEVRPNYYLNPTFILN